MNCDRCGKKMRYTEKLPFNGETLSGYRCSCGEAYYDPEEAQRILLRNKLRKKRVTAKLGRIRTNLILRLPKEIEEALAFKEGEEVALSIETDGLRIGKAH
jgi:hypothetical protein